MFDMQTLGVEERSSWGKEGGLYVTSSCGCSITFFNRQNNEVFPK